ncbi:MAG: hypothetical protein H0W99_02450 [Acidobacteria bacterium]|nr:hypothetical protein [Acidobacteriota bacterium]
MQTDAHQSTVIVREQARENTDAISSHMIALGDYLARVITPAKTSPALKTAWQAIIVNTMANESGYS